MTIQLYKGDIPNDLELNGSLAIDTEATGLNLDRDRLCVIQLSTGDGDAHLVQFPDEKYDAPNLKKLLQDDNILKIFHYARFDVAIIKKHLGIMVKNIYCTKIASKIGRTYSPFHGLKDICKELLSVHLSKQQQSSYWGSEKLSKDQLAYAASDVLYLHQLKAKLDEMLSREKRKQLADECFDIIELIVKLDLKGWDGAEIFSHKTTQ
jgi:ribonuclease D